MAKPITLKLEELEERIAPSFVVSLPSEGGAAAGYAVFAPHAEAYDTVEDSLLRGEGRAPIGNNS